MGKGRRPAGAPLCRDVVLAALRELDGKTVTRRELTALTPYAIYTVGEIFRQLMQEGEPLAQLVISCQPVNFRQARDGFALPDADSIVSSAMRSRTEMDLLWF